MIKITTEEYGWMYIDEKELVAVSVSLDIRSGYDAEDGQHIKGNFTITFYAKTRDFIFRLDDNITTDYLSKINEELSSKLSDFEVISTRNHTIYYRKSEVLYITNQGHIDSFRIGFKNDRSVDIKERDFNPENLLRKLDLDSIA